MRFPSKCFSSMTMSDPGIKERSQGLSHQRKRRNCSSAHSKNFYLTLTTTMTQKPNGNHLILMMLILRPPRMSLGQKMMKRTWMDFSTTKTIWASGDSLLGTFNLKVAECAGRPKQEKRRSPTVPSIFGSCGWRSYLVSSFAPALDVASLTPLAETHDFPIDPH